VELLIRVLCNPLLMEYESTGDGREVDRRPGCPLAVRCTTANQFLAVVFDRLDDREIRLRAQEKVGHGVAGGGKQFMAGPFEDGWEGVRDGRVKRQLIGKDFLEQFGGSRIGAGILPGVRFFHPDWQQAGKPLRACSVCRFLFHATCVSKPSSRHLGRLLPPP